MNHLPADDDQRRYMQNKEKKTASTKAFLALFIFFRPNNFRILIQILFIALCFIHTVNERILVKCCLQSSPRVTQVFIFLLLVASYFYTTHLLVSPLIFIICVLLFLIYCFFFNSNDDSLLIPLLHHYSNQKPPFE